MTDFSTIAITATGSTTPRTMPDRLTDITDVKGFGALGDGTGALLSSRYASLAAAQAVYPFVTSLSDTIDWAAIMAAYNHGQVRLVTSVSNQTASFTGQIAFATFNGTCSGNTLTINSGLSGTVVVGQTLRTSLGNRVITSGGGSSWTYGGATLAVGPEAMSTNAVLVASGVSGVIAIGNRALDSATAGLSSRQSIFAQQTGAAGGDGVYTVPGASNFSITSYTYNSLTGVVTLSIDSHGLPIQFVPGQSFITSGLSISGLNGTFSATATTGTSVTYTGTPSLPGSPTGGGTLTINPMNFGPAAMITVGGVLTFASVPNFASLPGQYLNDSTSSIAFDPVFVPKVSSATGTTLTYSEVFGKVNAGDTITVNLAAKGIIDFPPGTYNVSAPIDFSDPNLVNVIFRGAPGTTVVGNFADYVFKRAVPDTGGQSGHHAVEGFNVTNTHPNGGGIRNGYCVGGRVGECVVTANRGISTASDDTIAGVTSQEMAIENCYLTPGANPTGSIGIMSVSDGPMGNNHVEGFDQGIITWGQQGGMNILGGKVVLCKVGLQPGIRPDGGSDSGAGMLIAGMWFKNCGTAIYAGGGSTGGAIFCGVVIEAAEGTIAGDPQYGMRLDAVGGSLFLGVRVIGQYAQYAIEILGGEITNPADNWMMGVQAFNTSSLVRPAWSLPPTAGTVHFVNSNVAPVFTMAKLPAYPYGITSISWSAGTTTVAVAGNVGPLTGTPFTVTVSGITPSGFNGTFSATVLTTNSVTYAQSNPGAGSGTGSGTAIINLTPVATAAAANEGDCYNVSDSDTAAQGANPSATPGSNRVKVRWNGSNWTVIGK